MEFDRAKWVSSLLRNLAVSNAASRLDPHSCDLTPSEAFEESWPISSNLEKLRKAIWKGIIEAEMAGIVFDIKRHVSESVSYTHWYNHLISDPKRLSWLLNPGFTTKGPEVLLRRIAGRCYDLAFLLQKQDMDVTWVHLLEPLNDILQQVEGWKEEAKKSYRSYL